MADIEKKFEQFEARAHSDWRLVLAGLASMPRYVRVAYILLLTLFIVTSFMLLIRWSNRYLVEVPRHSGNLTEGIIGRPRFINPVIAKSDADRDMAALIYSGLMKATPDGTLIPDLAQSYQISPDGLTYTFTLRNDLFWQDGTPITSADIAFTIDKVRDPGLAIKSPRRASWDGVNVDTPDASTIVFQLKQPYAGFLENATMGIIPKHIWEKVPDDEFDVSYFNIEPIGSGPYRMGSITKDSDQGLPRYYDLIAFRRYALGEPYITNLRIQFFGNNQDLATAFANHTIDQMNAIAPEDAKALEAKGVHVVHTPLPRIFGAFFNQNQQPIFADAAVRQALDIGVDRQRIVDNVLDGYGQVIDSPIPSFEATTSPDASGTEMLSPDARIAKARAILEADGWQLNAANIYEKTDKKKKTVTLLQFSMTMPDIPELQSTAELMKGDWEKIGASVTLKVYDQSTFASEILAPRTYDVLFYGEVLGRSPDPYAYWHSSQRNSPGLNIALYANKTVDKILEDARKEEDPAAHAALLQKFVQELAKDTPAVFVYSPDFLYATSNKVYGIKIGMLTTESERFLDIEHWYTESERVWKWFVK